MGETAKRCDQLSASESSFVDDIPKGVRQSGGGGGDGWRSSDSEQTKRARGEARERRGWAEGQRTYQERNVIQKAKRKMLCNPNENTTRLFVFFW